MKLTFSKKRICGIVSVVPANCVRFEDEIDNYGFSREKSVNLMEVMGFKERRIVKDKECGSDLALHGFSHLQQTGALDPAQIDGLIVVTQTPDHFMPPTSCILHGKLGLKRDVLCFDINQGCAGYLYGLIQAFMLLDSGACKTVALVNCDTLSRRSCKRDRNIYPLIGDGASITILENAPINDKIVFSMKTDGSRSHWLIIPAGGFRIPSSEETRTVKELPDGNRRSEDDFFMNGSGIFTFTQTDVPALIQEYFAQDPAIAFADIDYFMFHQPNRFMLEKLAHKTGIPLEKMPRNIVEKFGNSSSVSIPLAICHTISQRIMAQRLKLCLAGFGVGLSWGMTALEAGPLDFCSLIEM